MDAMMRLLIPLAIVSLGVMIYSIIECAQTPRHRIRAISKPMWMIAIIFIPLIGGVLWLVFGNARGGINTMGRSGGAAPRPTSPDDDADFLRRLDAQRRQKARDEELNQREQELRKREDELRRGEQNDSPNSNNNGRDDIGEGPER